MKKIELLAPAGDLERAKTAILYGADAVYLGGKQFSLRSRASNFEIDDIAQAVRFASQHHAKVYVTVNIIPHDEDLSGLEDYLKMLDAIGVCAVICSSPYVIQTAKRVAPGMEVHVSTQQSVTNSKAIEFYRFLGVDRIVLARECSLDDIKQIRHVDHMPLEVFVHGGMCANYSGRCTMSNYLTHRDANRGGCAHSCRWFYHLYESKKEISEFERMFTLAFCDLEAMDYVKRLIDLGVVSLKVEGRMKSAYYIASVIKTYRMLIDEIYEKGTIEASRMAFFKEEQMRAENRPSNIGFFEGMPEEEPRKGLSKNIISQEFVANVVDYQDGKALIEVRNYFAEGDVLEVLSPRADQGTFVAGHMVDEEGNPVKVCNKPMQRIRLSVPYAVEPYDMLRKARNVESI